MAALKCRCGCASFAALLEVLLVVFHHTLQGAQAAAHGAGIFVHRGAAIADFLCAFFRDGRFVLGIPVQIPPGNAHLQVEILCLVF